ncbi:hypothetical protein B0T21DRAFT_369287 [Apiosordaria backusii]|uniref:Uncharacterized protein n=1 Tax=Apiosordaria backusii TaxID=314023 RepID=A0AA40BE51_9PEZI|nr:hypothetical protein B0T21DRAFT_369287 [Apiosordaria backusii]
MMVDLDREIPEGSDMGLEGEEEDEDEEMEGDLDDEVPEGGDLDDEIPEGDLDDDIPEGGGFGYDGVSDEVDDDEDEEDDDDDGEEEEDEEGEEGNNTFQTAQFDTSGEESSSSIDPQDISLTEVQQQRRVERRELQSRMASIRAQEQRMRELMVRGGQQSRALHGNDDDLYGAGEDDHDHHGIGGGGGQHNMLEEEDLVQSSGHQGGMSMVESGEDMDMNADLDDDIPDASGLSGVSGAGFGMDGAGYEHTDSEAELSSDDDGGNNSNANISFARGSVRGSVRRQQNFRSSGVGQQHHFRSSGMGRGGGGGRFDPRSSLGNNHDISGFLSLDGSSMIGSSPHRGSFRRSRQG